MKKFITYCLLFALPFVVLTIPYWIGDPFKVLRHYDLYCTPGEPLVVNINRSMVSERMFEQYRECYGWNSYIFGSSRSDYYRIADWESHLDSLSHGAHMAGYGESLYGIWSKLCYMEGKTELRNVLICLDKDILGQTKVEVEPLFCPLPTWSKEVTWLQFHALYLKTYLQPKFLRAYVDYWLTGQLKPYMVEDGTFTNNPFWYDVTRNEELNDRNAKIPDSVFYDAERVAQFYERPIEQQYEQMSFVGEEQKRMLQDIKDICERNHTDYRIVINPVYDQKKLLPVDMVWLLETFGEHLYDFSGINDLTSDYHHYYDLSHFRVEIAAEVMNRVYKTDKND